MERLHAPKPHEFTLLEGQVQKSACQGSTGLTLIFASCVSFWLLGKLPALIKSAPHPLSRGSHKDSSLLASPGVLFPPHLLAEQGCEAGKQDRVGLRVMTQGHPGPVSRIKVRSVYTYVSLCFRMDSQFSKSISFRLVLSSFSLGAFRSSTAASLGWTRKPRAVF